MNESVLRTLGEDLGLWQPVSHPESTIVRRAPALTFHGVCVPLSISSLARAHCARCSPSIPLWLASYLLARAAGRTQSPDCALPKCTQVCLCHMIGEELVFFSFLYIKLVRHGVQVQLGLTCLFCVFFFEQPRLHNAERQHNFLEVRNLLCLIS